MYEMTFDAKFLQAMKPLLFMEGDYRNAPSDPGGPTKYGIAQASHPKLDIRALTKEQATQLYWDEWWNKFGYGEIGNYALALKVFTTAINIGWVTAKAAASSSWNISEDAPRAHLFLQMAVNDVIKGGEGYGRAPLMIDGQLGPKTLEAVNSLDAGLLLLRFLGRVHAYYKQAAKSQPSELNGWENRLYTCV